jgi:hypothetical protein
MTYKEKYLKYKTKYISLRNNIGGNNDMCIINDVFDLDCFLPLTTNREKDYIFTKCLSKQTIDYIRSEIQSYYPYFYNFMGYPNLSNDELKQKDLLQEIIIPIIVNKQNDLEIGKVDYDLIAQKLYTNNVLDIIDIIKKQIQTKQELNNLVDDINIYSNNKQIEFQNLFSNLPDNYIEQYENIKNTDIKVQYIYDYQEIILSNINSDKSRQYNWNDVLTFWNDYQEKIKKS